MKRSQIIAGLAAAPLFARSGTRLARAQDLATVRVGELGISTDCPTWIADEKNYFGSKASTSKASGSRRAR
jgi:hypothetical protein